MPSPFPGMNPFLEQEDLWLDFLQSFIPVLRELLLPQVRPDYVVKVEQQIFVREAEDPDAPGRILGRADVGIPGGRSSRPGPSATIEAPARARIPGVLDQEPHAFLEVRDRQGGGVVTVIELLSPTNKRSGPDREQYLGKRRRIFASNVHLVEIDLLRGGPRVPLDDLPDCDYLVVVSRAPERPDVDVWPIRLRDPLPEIPIPLRAGGAEARIDLGLALHLTYDRAGYEDHVYRRRPQPLLHPSDDTWAGAILKGAGLPRD